MKPKPSSSIDCAMRSGSSASSKPELFEDVGTAGRRGDRAVPVLRDSRARRRGDERGGGRDVERPAAITSGAGSVDEVVALRRHRQDVCPHRLGAAGDLVGGLSLQPQGDEEPADLRGRRFARHDRVHHTSGFVASQVAAVEQVSESSLDHRPRKFSARSRPCGVRTDSGWNWTPSIGSSRCRTAITSPSAAVAETSKHSGTVVAAREW